MTYNIVLHSNDSPAFPAAVSCFVLLGLRRILTRARLWRKARVIFKHIAAYFLPKFVGLTCRRKHRLGYRSIEYMFCYDGCWAERIEEEERDS